MTEKRGLHYGYLSVALPSVDPPFRTRHRHGLSYRREQSFPGDWHAPENTMTGWFFPDDPCLSVGIGTKAMARAPLKV
jgi:hypothetical protein